MKTDRDIVTVYGRPGCVACRATTNRFDKYGVEYHYIDLEAPGVNKEPARALAQLAGTTALPLVVVDHPDKARTLWGGLDIDNIHRLTAKA